MVGDFTSTDLHLDISSKGALVRAQLLGLKVHVAGLQETRCKEAIWTGQGFINIQSHAQDGNWGCALLFNVEIPHGQLKGKD
eukprot:7464674-Pyramimonas_sp.AAC.1